MTLQFKHAYFRHSDRAENLMPKPHIVDIEGLLVGQQTSKRLVLSLHKALTAMLCPYLEFGDDLKTSWNPREVLANYHPTWKYFETFSRTIYIHRNLPGRTNETAARDLAVASLPRHKKSEKEMGTCKLVSIL